MKLCPQVQETDNCFSLLPVVSASQPLRGDYQVCIPFDNPEPPNDIVTVRLQLPAEVRCSRCTLRWTYSYKYERHIDCAFSWKYQYQVVIKNYLNPCVNQVDQLDNS
ncbi:hypothetical protein Fcan01_24094 [Folsomia candida]|uniref:Uncharacterized protein n=1 Tax=Folsomia candida TaxID=158441 RepID=A0A226D7M4_FOLCA|nr:hypothetical protein Fcan01_24094 [Folsomia candida]